MTIRPCAERGYVLVTVLVGMVLLALVAARLDERLGLFREASGQWGRWIDMQSETASARDELLFMLTTRPLTPLGFAGPGTLLRVDGRPYRLSSGVRFSVQDTRGLVSVAMPNPAVLSRWLQQRGLGDTEADALVDKLADYADTDPLRRLNGAEAPDYLAAGLPPPRDDWPISPYELGQVLGWHERPRLWERAGDLFTAVREQVLNPNTAPAELLLALPGATPEAVQAVLAARELRHLASPAEVQQASGLLVEDNPISFYPGLFYRLRLWRSGDARAMEYTAMLTPNAPVKPWLILEARQVPRPAASDESSDPPLIDWAADLAAAPATAPRVDTPAPAR